MTDDKNKTAYIGIEREENSLKYIAKVFNEAPREITKAQYNAIVKSLREQDWSNNIEDEASIISNIINSHLEPTKLGES
jgi:hypothetical protein